MRSPIGGPRRPNLATIVGSGLAVAAAGSLLAFSSLAEQAGLQGLATGGLQPAVPGRAGGTTAITIPAPAAPPGEPATPEETLRDLVTRVELEEPAPRAPITPDAAPERVRPRRPDPKPARRERTDEGPVLAARAVAPAYASDDAEPAEPAGPPYGKAKGHDEHPKSTKDAKAKSQRRPKAQGRPAPQAPVYAKSQASGGKKPKAPKMKRVTKAPAASRGKGHGNDQRNGSGHAKGKGKGRGHGKHAHGHGNGNGEGRGHGKHAHGHGKGKGHSKHGR